MRTGSVVSFSYCTKCGEERSSERFDLDGRFGHRLPPCDGDMWTEDDWCDGEPRPYVAFSLNSADLDALRNRIERTINEVREQGLGITSTARAILVEMDLTI